MDKIGLLAEQFGLSVEALWPVLLHNMVIRGIMCPEICVLQSIFGMIQCTMKLIFCTMCQDLFKLSLERKNCKCGRCCGRYIDDLNAEFSGPAIPLGISNTSLGNAIVVYNKEAANLPVEMFTIPSNCKTMIKREIGNESFRLNGRTT